MTPEEIKLLQDVSSKLDAYSKKLDDFLNIYYRTNFIDKIVFEKALYLKDGSTLSLGASTGGKIGATSEKIGFLGKTPVARQVAISAPTAPGAAYVQAEAASAKTAIDSIRAVLTAFGLTS